LTYYRHWKEPKHGTAVVLLHGLLSRAHALGALGDLLAKRGMRAVALDLRAHGDSAAPRDPAAYRDQAMARDVLALAEHLEFHEYSLFGYGVGAELTSRAINLGAPVTRAVMCGWGGLPTDLLEEYASAAGRQRLIQLAEGLEAEDPGSIPDREARAWREAAERGGADRLGVAARLRSGDSGEAGLDPRGITIPVLVICGAEDASPHAFAAALPNARGLVVQGGHTTAGRDPSLSVAAADFLVRRDGAPT